MPTVPIAKMILTGNAIAFKDVTGEITRMPLDVKTLAIALTEAEWITLRKCLQHAETWFAVEGVNDKR